MVFSKLNCTKDWNLNNFQKYSISLQVASHFYKYAQNDRPISIYLEMFLSLFFFNSVQTDCAYSVALKKEVFF